MFNVISYQNNQDSTVPSEIIIITTANPVFALKAVRDAIADKEEEYFMSSIFIWQMKPGVRHTLNDFKSPVDSPSRLLMFKTWKPTGGGEWLEQSFNQDFPVFEKTDA